MTANTPFKAFDPLSVALSHEWRQRAACRDSAPTDGTSQPHPWFPTRSKGASNHGGPGKAACASCPAKQECLLYAVATNVAHGIWGGQGEASRRLLRRAFVRDGMAPGPRYEMAVQVTELEDAPPPDRNGDGATHGRRSTYARGCRNCEACRLAASFDGTMAKIDARRAA